MSLPQWATPMMSRRSSSRLRLPYPLNQSSSPNIMPTQPELPLPIYHDANSVLSKRFGQEVVNYFAGSPLNRVSFLRQQHNVISTAVAHPSARFLLLNTLAPLGQDPSTLAYVAYSDVEPLFRNATFDKTEEEMIKEYDSSLRLPLVVFLGLDEKQQDGFEYQTYKGTPYFAVDVTTDAKGRVGIEQVMKAVAAKNLSFIEGRVSNVLRASEAAVYGQARALIDWNTRNPFCAGCGQPTLSVNFGTKRVCPPMDNASPPIKKLRPPCSNRQGTHNLAFPRTDPTVIMAVLSSTSTHLLLGRQARWPLDFYSVLAGFCEPAESVEEAVRREVWEETGVKIGRVVLHSTQPWPYPANLMIGAVAQAVPNGEVIYLEHDKELEDARWVKIEEVKIALAKANKGLDQVLAGDEGTTEHAAGELHLPPRTTISHQLLKAVTEGFGV